MVAIGEATLVIGPINIPVAPAKKHENIEQGKKKKTIAILCIKFNPSHTALNTMFSAATFHPLSWYVIGTLFFYHAIQQKRSFSRHLLSALHISSMIVPLSLRYDMSRINHCSILAPFIIYSTIHTTSMLYADQRVLQLNSPSLIRRLREVFRLWSNIRRAKLTNSTERDIKDKRMSFAMRRICHAGAMWLMYRLFAELTVRALRGLNAGIRDFTLSNQSILPRMRSRDLCIRGVMSVNWIWSSYAILAGAHDLLAAFFVSLLGWDQPDGWPSLFGNPVEVYSLRRFWGVFWHQLHTNLYESFIPSFLRTSHTSQSQRVEFIRKSLRAFWMFFLSAICHIFANWVMFKDANLVPEMRFFLINYALCLTETVGKWTVRKTIEPGWWSTRVIGYVWVLFVFICLVPGWRYPLMLDAAYKS